MSSSVTNGPTPSVEQAWATSFMEFLGCEPSGDTAVNNLKSTWPPLLGEKRPKDTGGVLVSRYSNYPIFRLSCLATGARRLENAAFQEKISHLVSGTAISWIAESCYLKLVDNIEIQKIKRPEYKPGSSHWSRLGEGGGGY